MEIAETLTLGWYHPWQRPGYGELIADIARLIEVSLEAGVKR